MKKFFKKTILCLLVICMLLGCISCSHGVQEDTNADNTTEADDGTAKRVDKVNILLDGAYADIVFAIDANVALKNATKDFAKSYASVVGANDVTPQKSGVYDADKPEILVGKVKYPECEEIYSTLKYSEVKICVVGNKLVVAGYDSETMADALAELVKKLKENVDSDGNIILGADFSIEKTFVASLSAVPVFDGVKPNFIDTGDDCYMVNFGTVQRDKFEAYCETMDDNGLTLYSEKNIEGNMYKTYINDSYVVTAIYTKHNNKVKVLSEPLSKTALPTKAEDNVYTPVADCTTTITQVGLFDGNANSTYNGMCYVIRLADGSFIVVDGGFDRTGYPERIYNVLKKQAPNPDKIVIAAWIITHAHDDHVDVFESFFKSYGDKLTVERFICNFPAIEQLKDNWANEREGNENYVKMMREFLYTSFPNVPIVKAHPGQEFNLRNAKINILYTVDVYDKKLDDFNNTSVVFKLEAEGKSMLFLGDYDDKGDIMSKLYTAETLKSDLMQVAHHGLPENSSNKVLAEKIAPTYAFLPAGAQVVKNGSVDLFAITENQYLVNNCEILLAEDNVYVFTMKDFTYKKYDTVAAYLAS